jgi:hypothetical protein
MTEGRSEALGAALLPAAGRRNDCWGAAVGGKVEGGNYFVFAMNWWPPVQSGWMGEMSMSTEVVGVGRDLISTWKESELFQVGSWMVRV